MHTIRYGLDGLAVHGWADPITGYVWETVAGHLTAVFTEGQVGAYVTPNPAAFAVTPPEGPKSGGYIGPWIDNGACPHRGHTSPELWPIALIDYGDPDPFNDPDYVTERWGERQVCHNTINQLNDWADLDALAWLEAHADDMATDPF